MKNRRNQLKALSVIMGVALAFGLTFVQTEEANAYFGYFRIYTTQCVDQNTGAVVGSANDCTSGPGSCRDRGCATGEAERWPPVQ